MTDALIGLYEHAETIDKVVNELIEIGCAEKSIRVLGLEEDEADDLEREVLQELRRRKVEENEARSYADAVNEGKILVVAVPP